MKSSCCWPGNKSIFSVSVVLWPASSHVQAPQFKRTVAPDYKPLAWVRSSYRPAGCLFKTKTALSSQDPVQLDLGRAKDWRPLYASQSLFISMIFINKSVLQKEVTLSGERGS